MVKLGRYAALSAAGAIAIIIPASRSREQFYPAMLYLATSKINSILLLNIALVIMCMIWQAIQTVFLGTLREAEVERLNEQSWREVMEILFAMTIFREEFNVTFVAMVTVLLFIKAFHWLSQTRVEFIETTPSVSRLSHFRITIFLAFLLALDILFLQLSVSQLLRTQKASVSLFFAFEYVILATSTIATFLKYVLSVGDMVMEGQWDSKPVYIFYIELVRDLLHLSLYLSFFFVIFIQYGLPLHLVREFYETCRNCKARVADFIQCRKITSKLNNRFPDATEEELGRDATCIICREEMSTAKKLQCGHFFHVHCLRSWLEQQQTCPTCRALVFASEYASPTAADPPAGHLQGQGFHPDMRSGQGQDLAQRPGTSPAASMRHPMNMHAAVSANNLPHSAVTCLSLQSGNIAWYPACIPIIPRGHLVGAPQSSNYINEAGTSGPTTAAPRVMQKQLQTAMLLQRQLSSLTTGTRANPDIGSSREGTIETSPAINNEWFHVKEKPPVTGRDEETRPLNRDVPPNIRAHDLDSLTVQEQGIVSPPPVVENRHISCANNTSSDEPDNAKQRGHGES